MKKFKMVSGEVTVLLGDRATSNGQFSFEGVMVTTKPNVLFKSYVSSFDKKEEGELSIVSLRDYIYSKIRIQADSDLKDYIAEHIGDVEFYTKKYEDGRDEFFSQGMNFKDEFPEISEEIDISLDKIGDGLVNCKIAYSQCIYDLVQDKFISIKSSDYHDAKDIAPLDIFYKRDLRKIIAIEQYKIGKAHKLFTEIVNLNKFLDGKKSVKLVMKNGDIHTLKGKGDIRASQILNFANDKIYIDDNYNLMPRMGRYIEAKELDYLQFGKNKYTIDSNNLTIE